METLENETLQGQMNIFDYLEDPNEKISFKGKPIRLIELFAGVGSQAMALRDIGADFEHYRVVEFDKYAIASYNAIHGTDFPTMDVTKISGADLGIVEKDKYTYLLTYSFPCTDLSVAGRMQGMAEGSGTRSSLLWECKRLLEECEELPQILVMENVPQVHNKANMPHFQRWLDFLESKGYKNWWQDMNAKNYGVAQSRNRTICVSVLGNFDYKFPMPYPLKKVMKDYLEPKVDEKYYIKNEKARELIDKLVKGGKITNQNDVSRIGGLLGNHQAGSVYEKEALAPTLMAGMDHGNTMPYIVEEKEIGTTHYPHGWLEENASFNGVSPTIDAGIWKQHTLLIEKEQRLGNIYGFDGGNYGGNVYDKEALAPTLNTMQGGNKQPMIINTMQICAMRGRDPKNPSNRTPGNPNLEQRLEINSQGIANTLTTVQKDNLVLVKQATKDGYIPCDIGGVADLSYPNSQTRRGRVIDQGQTCPTLTTENIPSVLEDWMWEIDGITYLIRIRKLTPRECWRLMDFTDEDFEKAQTVNSNTQLYKQAGNSIVKNVLCEVFRNLLR
ncbi:MAG: DNA (cytosine-5-)-methyltransferase [Bacteroidales bacterium]|nr:DNA (cytosine-5-)-methyltransferase [Candidatus Scybalousia scybalohippi]